MKRSHRVTDRVKRVLDAVLAFSLLVLLAPSLAAIALMVRLNMGRPILFRQTRPGRDGALFTIYKFRSMRAADDVGATRAVATDAARLTRFGRFLRATSLDELPELYNILVGDMSFVGPRPLLPEYLDRYNTEQARRHEVRPGLTGWAQVNGRNATSWEDRFAMDVWYVDNRSLLLDLKIMLLTLRTVLRREGVSAPGSATMEPFDPRRGGSDREDV